MSSTPAPSTDFISPPVSVSIRPGEPFPLGATWDGRGTNFAVFSEVAERVELCLFDADGRETRIALPERTAFCWHAYLPGVHPGQMYGYRVTVRGIQPRGSGAILPSCSSIPTPSRSPAASSGTTPCFRIPSAAMIWSATIANDVDENGKRVRDASFLLLFNAHHEPLDFTLPPGMFGNKWSVVLDTGTEMGEGDGVFAAGATVPVQGRSIIVLSRP
jgi:pullulanase/glycogen debranching enzyme